MTDELGDGVSGVLTAGIATGSGFSTATTSEAPGEIYSLFGASKG